MKQNKQTAAQSEQTTIVSLLALSAVLAILAGVLFTQNHDYRGTISAYRQGLTAPGQQAVNGMEWHPVTISQAEHAVLLPDAHLKLPLTERTAQLVYSLRTANDLESVVDVSTAAYEAFVPTQDYRLACTPLRLAFEAKANPYNPQEKTQPAVKLADGRTLQIYPFQEASCTERWSLSGVDSFAIAKAFQSAESY